MGQQVEMIVQRLRRFARALCRDSETADALVLEALSSHDGKRLDYHRLLTVIIARRRDLEEREASVKPQRLVPKTASAAAAPPDILRAFERLGLPDREVLALISVEGMPYEEAASVLALREETFIARLTRARAAFARQVDGERHVVLRIVK
ncbi:sigma factor-like helix-turn-helix DNA-binding protein [Labrys okinawensis]|uniref:sigma factor-like helix-turn-helix DNA-binding protein n=1 Tax=Labrys okinawensis TaxID=346911 RepID=UPI0039BCDEF8